MAELTISNVAVKNITGASATVTWDTNKAANSWVQYGLTAAYGSVTPKVATPVVKHSVVLAGLTPGTTYHYSARSGSVHFSPDATFDTTGGVQQDTTAPTVSITAPKAAAVVKGMLGVTATAGDNIGVSGVSFYCDGTPIGNSPAVPYGVSVDTRTMPDGPHTLMAKATDAAGNIASSASVNITVQNAAAVPPGFFFAVNGSASGDGSVTRPWDVITAFAHPAALTPGSTLWARGGLYFRPAPPVIPGKQAQPGGYKCAIKGVAGNRITVRAYPGERVQFDANQVKGSAIDTQSRYVDYRDLEIFNSDPRRVTPISGSAVTPDWRKDGITCHSGPENNFINCVIHDTGSAIGFWEQNVDGLLYGLVTFNNGWIGPDRGHGHGAYIQNQVGTKVIRHCLSWDNFATGMKAYATASSAAGVHFEGVITLENGLAEALGDTPPSNLRNEGILSGTESLPQQDIRFEDCFHYAKAGAASGYRLGIGSKAVDVTMLRCTSVAGQCVSVQNWDMVTMLDCEFFVRSLACNVQTAQGQDPSQYVIDRNKFHDQSPISSGSRHPFGLTGIKNAFGAGKLNYGEWKTPYHWNQNGMYDELPFSGIRTAVFANEWRDQWDTKAGIIGIMNFDHTPTVQVDVSGMLQVGDNWRLQSIEDYFGTPVASGVYDGNPITVPVTGGTVVGPIGYGPAIPTMGPEAFGGVIFVD